MRHKSLWNISVTTTPEAEDAVTELLSTVLGLPASDKKRGPIPKGLLVEACKDLLPESVYRRPKLGFGLPMNIWMRGPLKDLVKTGLTEAAARSGLAEEFIQSLYEQFNQGPLHWTRLWSVVVLGHFLRRAAQAHFPRPPAQAPPCESYAPSVQ